MFDLSLSSSVAGMALTEKYLIDACNSKRKYHCIIALTLVEFYCLHHHVRISFQGTGISNVMFKEKLSICSYQNLVLFLHFYHDSKAVEKNVSLYITLLILPQLSAIVCRNICDGWVELISLLTVLKMFFNVTICNADKATRRSGMLMKG